MRLQPILLAEDRDTDAELTVLALRQAGIAHPVVRARDGVEVLDYLFASSGAELPSLVLLDLRMPRLDGLDTLKAIRTDTRARNLPVIVMTCSDEEKRRFGPYDDASTHVACKPLDPAQLAAATTRLGLGGLMHREGK
jgi:two-component system response regulator